MDKDTAPLGRGCPLVDLDRRPAPGALRRRARADTGRAAANYRQVNSSNKSRPLPSIRAGQRPVVQVDSRCIAPHKGLQYSSFWSIFEKNFHLFF